MCVYVCVGLRRQRLNIKIISLQLRGWTVASKAVTAFYLISATAQIAPNMQTMVKSKHLIFFNVQH